jgi:phenylalanyl-tRNA synthetase beta chain
LTSIDLFDIFTSKELGSKRSMAYSMSFQSPVKTMTDEEVNAAFTKIVNALKTDLKVEVRDN